MSLERVTAGTEADLTAKSVRYITDCIVRFQRTRLGNFILGLSGTNGQVRRARAKDVFKGLATQEAIDWNRVYIFLVDERYDFEIEEDCNAHLVRTTLIATLQERGIIMPEDHIVFPDATIDSWEECAQEYEVRLLQLFESQGAHGPHLVILGLASDKSIASVFPEWYLESPERWMEAAGKKMGVLCTETTTFEVPLRICVNLRVIRAAESIVVYLGSGVEEAWQEVQNEFSRMHRGGLYARKNSVTPKSTPSTAWPVSEAEPPGESEPAACEGSLGRPVPVGSFRSMASFKSMSSFKSGVSFTTEDTPDSLNSKLGGRRSSETEVDVRPRISSRTALSRCNSKLGRCVSMPEDQEQDSMDPEQAAMMAKLPRSPLGYVMKFNFVCVVQLRKDHENHHALVVLGAAGDLAKKKTLPSIFQLFLNRVLPTNTAIIGCDDPTYHSDIQSTDDWWEKRLEKHLQAEGRATDLCDFREQLEFVPVSLSSPDAMRALDENIRDRARGMNDHRIFYLALPPFLFETAVQHIRQECWSEPSGFVRVVVEKPFGKDLSSARELTRKLAAYLEERQIFRIDHYLAKTMVMNILTLRFANRELGRLFHADNVANVRITFKEDIGVQGRAGYFDSYGIIRDIMQNHLLQLLTLVLMEAPASLKPEDVRDEKVKVLKQIRQVQLSDCIVGQYDGYQNDPDIQKINEKKGYPSRCPTFALCVLYLDNERWSGVPLILKAAKAVETRSTIVRLQFKKAPPNSLFGDQPQNELVMRVQPNEHIFYTILAKTPGLSSRAHEVWRTTLDLDLRKEQFGRAPEAYEKLIYDVIKGNSHNFVRGDEVEEGWKIFDPLISELESPNGPVPETYPIGGRGPRGADELLNRLGYRQYTKTGVVGYAGDDFS